MSTKAIKINKTALRITSTNSQNLWTYSCVMSLIAPPKPNLSFGQDKKSSAFITVYPNPTTDKITLNTEGVAEGIVNIELIDILGRRVLYLKQELQGWSNTIDLDIRSFSKGLYSVKVTDAQNEQIVLKVVKD